MQKSLDIEFEKAVRMLVEYFPISKEDSRKPVLFHDIRVGIYLWEKGFSREIVIAGLLHDALEFSDLTQEIIGEEFGGEVVKIVKACTKDRAIADSDERIRELAKRSAKRGKDALIVRAADTLDSFKHYTKTNNFPELEYCRKNAEEILKYVEEGLEEKVFEDLRNYLNN